MYPAKLHAFLHAFSVPISLLLLPLLIVVAFGCLHPFPIRILRWLDRGQQIQ